MRTKIIKCWIYSHECCRCLTTNPDDRLSVGFLFYDDVIVVAIYIRKVMILITADSRNVSSPWKWRTSPLSTRVWRKHRGRLAVVGVPINMFARTSGLPMMLKWQCNHEHKSKGAGRDSQYRTQSVLYQHSILIYKDSVLFNNTVLLVCY